MFPGFGSADFSAYEPRKWKSNVFNRERMEVKQKLTTLGQAVQPGLADADGAPLQLDISVEHPAHFNHKQVEAQHLYFSRNEGSRKELDAIVARERSMASLFEDPSPQRNHLFLVVTVDQAGVEIGLKLHPDAKIDRQNLERKIAEHFELEKALYLLARVPGYRVAVGAIAEGNGAAAEELDAVGLAAIVAHFGAAAGGPLAVHPGAAALFTIAKRFTVAEVVAAGADFGNTVRDELARLLPLYHYVAWNRGNDFVSMKEQLQKEKQTQRQRGLAKHDPVRIVKGMLAGKAGVVQEVDTRGGLRVLVGKMVIKVDAEDVVKS